jgi:hypothetical protein
MATYSSKKYPSGSVTSAQLADGTVVAVDLADGAITSAKLNSTVDLSGKTVTYRSIVAGDIASNAITTAKISDAAVSHTKMANAGAELGMRNRLINGALTIDQRNSGASYSALDSTYGLDRWKLASWDGSGTVTGKYTVQQSSTAPAGFANSMLITSSAATTIGSGAIYWVGQMIEGLNTADLGWGAANAQTVTVSFWVRSSLTGTFAGSVLNSASDRSYPFSYTISSANTFEYKTITIAGDTSGTWLKTTGIGIRLVFSLGIGTTYQGTANAWVAGQFTSVTGSTSLLATNGATLYIAGVQLEVGSTATPFENRPYGTELALCQRYYQNHGAMFQCGQAYGTGTDGFTVNYPFPVTMRAAPTSTVVGGSDGGSAAQLVVSNINTYKCTFEVRNNGGGATSKWYTWYQAFSSEI